jgi:hypothetical protein
MRGGAVQAATWALEPVARQRQEAVRREVGRCRARRPRARSQGPWRVRLGWTLVELGLRLALGGGAQTMPGTRVLPH